MAIVRYLSACTVDLCMLIRYIFICQQRNMSIEKEAGMSDLISIPLEVFGFGFATAMCIAVLMKIIMDIIKHFSKEEKMTQ